MKKTVKVQIFYIDYQNEMVIFGKNDQVLKNLWMYNHGRFTIPDKTALKVCRLSRLRNLPIDIN